MEIRHCFCKDFLMIVGEVGPVEVELIYSIIFFFTGTVWGSECFEKDMTDLTGLGYGFLEVKLKYTIGVLTFFLLLIFTYDNVKDSLNINPRMSLKLFIPVFNLVGISYFCTFLPSYTE